MTPILPPATLGLLRGGQLGRYFVQAARELGYQVWVLDPDPDCPAGHLSNRHLAAGFDDAAALAALAANCAAITTEFENVPAASLEQLSRSVSVRPGAGAVAVCQDRRTEKGFVTEQGLRCGPWVVVDSPADIAQAPDTLFPGILKTARLGYDGKGQSRVATRAEAVAAFDAVGGRACVLEALLPLDLEISVVLARTASGETACFPVVENQHRNGILDISIAPARLSPALADQARDCARRIASALDYVGTLGVEFFVSGGSLFVNELAPRPHNSGHYTLDACHTSQYEQQVRALCGLPLGDPTAHSAAVMVNLLGDLWFDQGLPREPDWASLLARPALRLRLYGKTAARPGRKMGHYTVVGPELEPAIPTALAARAALGMED